MATELNKQTITELKNDSMDELIGIYLKRIHLHEPGFFLVEPTIEACLVDKVSGNYAKGNLADSNSYASPFALTPSEDANRSPFQLLIIEDNFSELGSESKLLVFEVCQKVRRKKAREFENKRIAWAFLVPLASDGSMNTNKDLKLQLYKVRKDCKVSHQDCNVYHLYSEHKRKKLRGYVEIIVKGVALIKTKPSPTKEVEDDQPEKEKPRQALPVVETSPKVWQWSRLPSQTCRIPNKIHGTHNLGKDGVSCLRFSRNGVYVACAALTQIVVHEVIPGTEIITLDSHFGFIYDLDWSLDDRQILSVSNDCRAAIWSLHQKTPLFVLPHPSYVYCGKWFGSSDRIITGGRDHTLRFWIKNEGGFDLVEEIPDHSGFISAFAVQDETVVIGDSLGRVTIRKYADGSFALLKELSFPETNKRVIDCIHFHTSRRRVVLTVRSRGSYLVDVVSGLILHSYKSGVNVLARLISCLTPCGSMLFSFCQNGDVGVWEVNTGRLLASYGNLFPVESLTDLSGCIQYHPHEHMLGMAALGRNCAMFLLTYDTSRKNDSERLGLVFVDKKAENRSPRTSKQLPVGNKLK